MISEADAKVTEANGCQSAVSASDSNVLQFPEHASQEQIFRGRKLGHKHLNPSMELARKQKNGA